MNNLILIFDPLTTKPTLNQIAAYVRDSRDIVSWHAPWLGSYLLKSELGAYDLSQKILGLFDGAKFVISQAKNYETAGWLEDDIWKWWNATGNSEIQKLLS